MAGEWLSVALWAMSLAEVRTPTLAERLTAVREAYRRGGTMSAAFTQTYHDAMRPAGKTRREAGELWVDAGGRVRWSYRDPERKEFVFDGVDGYFYEPEQQQVTIFGGFSDSPLGSSIQVLWGRGDVTRLFQVQACEALPKTAFVPPNELCVQLLPHRKVTQVARVILGLDVAAQRINRSLLVDQLNNTTEFVFQGVEFGGKLPADRFLFVKPEGVEVFDTR